MGETWTGVDWCPRALVSSASRSDDTLMAIISRAARQASDGDDVWHLPEA